MIEIVGEVLHGQAFANVALHDSFDDLIDRLYPALSLAAQPNAGRDSRTDGGNGADTEGPRDDPRQRFQNTNAATENQDLPIGQRPRLGDDRPVAGIFTGPDQFHLMHPAVGGEIGRYERQISRQTVAVSGEERGEAHVVVLVLIFMSRSLPHGP